MVLIAVSLANLCLVLLLHIAHIVPVSPKTFAPAHPIARTALALLLSVPFVTAVVIVCFPFDTSAQALTFAMSLAATGVVSQAHIMFVSPSQQQQQELYDFSLFFDD